MVEPTPAALLGVTIGATRTSSPYMYYERVPISVGIEVAVPHLSPAWW